MYRPKEEVMDLSDDSTVGYCGSSMEYQIAHNINSTNNLFIPIARTMNYGLKLTKVIGPKIWNS